MMCLAVDLQQRQNIPQQLVNSLQFVIQKVIDCVKFIYDSICKVFSHIANSPSILRHYVVFQTVEWVIPPFLKSTVNSCYCYVRDLFSGWTHQSLESEIKTLTDQKKLLETQYKSALKKIDSLIESRDLLIAIGNLDQTIQKTLNTELTALRQQLSLALEGMALANKRAISTREEADSLRREIEIGEKLLSSASLLHLSDSNSFSPEDLNRLSKYGIHLGDSACPLTPAIRT